VERKLLMLTSPCCSKMATSTRTGKRSSKLFSRHEKPAEEQLPISVLFERYYAERKLSPKTKLEWDGVLDRFMSVCGDVPVRAITVSIVRQFKDAMLKSTGRTGTTLKPATVRKLVAALSSVLKLGKRNGYLTFDPADGITGSLVRRDHNDDSGRLPYDAGDLSKLFAKDAVETKRAQWLTRGRPADYWLPYLGLYTGARLEELGQLRVADVRQEDGVWFLAIEPGDGKRVKTKGSKRRIPVLRSPRSASEPSWSSRRRLARSASSLTSRLHRSAPSRPRGRSGGADTLTHSKSPIRARCSTRSATGSRMLLVS